MPKTPEIESPAYLRHEYRTPVNHIVGYSELLIEEARDRRLEPYIPAFQRIHDGGHKLLESIRIAFDENASPGNAWETEAFRTDLNALMGEISRTLASVDGDLRRDHRETLADLAAISGGIGRLCELIGREEVEIPATGCEIRSLRQEEISRNAATVPMERIPMQRGGGKILIADDDRANRDLLRRRLECEGHEVVEAGNGLEVLASLKENPCDLVLLDILMPGMDGFQTLARMKQDAALRELPVIMISAVEQLQSVVRCIEMGAVDYLPKPFNRVLLRARIGASLERKRLVDRERRKAEELEHTLSLLEKAQEQLSLQASRDTLTGLANRRSVEAQLDTRIRRADPFAAIYIDLNGFKRINDTYGHATGDELLKQVGARLRSAFRSTDTIGRWGGDEFVALVDADNSGARIHISRVRECLAEDFAIACEPRRVSIGAAIGAATWKPSDTASSLLHRADFAMYEEKLRTAG